ncbi:MAG: F0F1 ATP synthase subunit epsilon [Actinomycetota bacterium]
MADRSLTVDIVTPERVVLSEEAVSVRAPGVEGSFGILPNHAPMLAELIPGELDFRRQNGQEVRLAVGGGFLQVFNNLVTVLADSAERLDEIDVDRARRALEAAQADLRAAQASYDPDRLAQAESAVARAQSRIRIANS